MGGTCGGVFGCLGGLIGWLSSKAKARTFVMTVTWALVLFGAICLLFGVIALADSQPYAVCYPLLLMGVLTVAIPGGALREFRRRYEEAELRRMQAMDA